MTDQPGLTIVLRFWEDCPRGISTANRSEVGKVANGLFSMTMLDEPYLGFNDRVTEEVQDRFGLAWEVQGHEANHARHEWNASGIRRAP